MNDIPTTPSTTAPASTTYRPSTRSASRIRLDELTTILNDRGIDRSTRLLRLQGWRGADLRAACATGSRVHRLAPGVCAGLSLAIGATGSFGLLVVVWGTAVIGVFARNHPIELGYNRIASRVGMIPIPANRAGKRLGCAIGTLMLGACGIAFLVDQPTLARVLAIAMGCVAAFVALTNLCVPSIIFTLLWGSDLATAPSLVAAARRRLPIASDPGC